jgi:hypothetical protein
MLPNETPGVVFLVDVDQNRGEQFPTLLVFQFGPYFVVFQQFQDLG